MTIKAAAIATLLGGIVLAAVNYQRILVMGSALRAENTAPLKFDPRATEAVSALRKLESKTSAGISFINYVDALGEAQSAVKQFRESDESASVPDFTNILVNANKWYLAGAKMWSRQVKAPVGFGYCAPIGLPSFQAKSLCDDYPELVETLPGRIPTPGMSLKFSISSAYLDINIAALARSGGRDWGGSPGLIYDLAVKVSWLRAEVEAVNAQHWLNGEPLERVDEKDYRIGRRAALGYLLREADKFSETQ